MQVFIRYFSFFLFFKKFKNKQFCFILYFYILINLKIINFLLLLFLYFHNNKEFILFNLRSTTYC